MEENFQPTPLGRGSLAQRKSYRLFYVLAAFNLLTVLSTLYLGHCMMGLYDDAVHVNHEWVTRAESYSLLGQLVLEANAPGNDVFATGDVEKESRRIEISTVAYHELFEELKLDSNNLRESDPHFAEPFSRQLEELETPFEAMVDSASEIFEEIDGGDREQAGVLMAEMDRHYGEASKILASLRHKIGAEQIRKLGAESAAGLDIQRWESVIAGAIVVMVGCICLYGRMISREMRNATEIAEKNHIAATESEARIRAIVDHAADGIVTFNDDGTIESLNGAVESIFGVTREACNGRLMSDFLTTVSEDSGSCSSIDNDQRREPR